MKNLIALIGWVSVAAAAPAGAQNLVITNARILDGTGKVIERGAVVVRDGKIAYVKGYQSKAEALKAAGLRE